MDSRFAQHGRFRHGPENNVLLEHASRGDSGVILIIKTDELREGYTKYHAISSIDAR